MRLYHSTTPEAAEKIVADGFRDSSGYYMIPDATSGVWLADMPLDSNEGAKQGTVLLVDLALSEEQIAQFEWIEEGKPYREWQIPAKLINENASIRAWPLISRRSIHSTNLPGQLSAATHRRRGERAKHAAAETITLPYVFQG